MLVEEESARVAIECFAERLGFADAAKVIPHEGKSDLERSIRRKIAGWHAPRPPRFVIAMDGSAAARDAIKQRLLQQVPLDARHRTKVRIVVHELESWFLGDPAAVERAGLLSDAPARRRLFRLAQRNLCQLSNPVQELSKLLNVTGKIARARAVAPHMNLQANAAASFAPFIEALRWSADD
ncbi:DUF4276 family protein [Leptolyngbya sp. 15MV]|nr:DUF4276 family protein [Leptolyngbya sp. 15MV]